MIDIYKLTTKTNKMSLLYVEDNDMVREDTETMLDIFFENITIAKNGLEGLACYESAKYDLIITDIKMPLMNGISMISKIRESDKEIPVIIISAYDEDYNLYNIKHLNVEAYITKPFVVDELIATIHKVSS